MLERLVVYKNEIKHETVHDKLVATKTAKIENHLMQILEW